MYLGGFYPGLAGHDGAGGPPGRVAQGWRTRRGRMVALLGPAVGAAAYEVGTWPVFSTATVAGAALMVVAFLVRAPHNPMPQGLRKALAAVGDRRVGTGLWLTMLAGMAFGVLDVLVPLRLADLGASALLIAGTFLASSAIEGSVSPLAGRQADRRGAPSCRL